jgi:hypothetical protein
MAVPLLKALLQARINVTFSPCVGWNLFPQLGFRPLK